MTQLITQLKNTDEIRKILKEVTFKYSWSGEVVDVHLIYLPCVNGICDISSLLEIIKKGLLTNFVLSHKEIQKKIKLNCQESEEELFNKAVRAMSRKTAHGELGELLLFTMIELYLGAPKILSKVSKKTSRRMPVHGADAVHAQYVDGKIRLYLGESKLRKSFSSSVVDAAKSIANARVNYEREFDLIDSDIDFPEINEQLEKDLLSVLNPFASTFCQDEILHSPCFIGFSEPECFLDENSYINKYVEAATEYVERYYSQLHANKIHHNKSTLFLLPFSSI